MAVGVLMDWLEAHSSHDALTAVGHRVVHGGPTYSQPQRITPAMLEELHRISPFDPEHLPEEIQLTEAFHHRFPDLPQVACFDTAFHHDLPRVAQMLPIPRRYEAQGIRRYGFHGLSYTFLMEELARLDGAPFPRSSYPRSPWEWRESGSGASRQIHRHQYELYPDSRGADEYTLWRPRSGVARVPSAHRTNEREAIP